MNHPTPAPALTVKLTLTLPQARDLQFALEDMLGKLLEEANDTRESYGAECVEDHIFDYMQVVNIARRS